MTDLLESLLFVASVLAVAVGVAMIYIPAGLIVLGLSCALILVLADRGRA